MKIVGTTYGEMYGPAMEITDQAQADEYFASLVAEVTAAGKTQVEAETLVRTNLGYWAGYYSEGVRKRVEDLYSAVHPVLGKLGDRKWSAKEIFQAGVDAAADGPGAKGEGP